MCPQVLGYDSHAAYVLETRMAKSPGTVLTFLTDLEAKLQPGAAKGGWPWQAHSALVCWLILRN